MQGGWGWLHQTMSLDSGLAGWSVTFPVLFCWRNVHFSLSKMPIEGCRQQHSEGQPSFCQAEGPPYQDVEFLCFPSAIRTGDHVGNPFSLVPTTGVCALGSKVCSCCHPHPVSQMLQGVGRRIQAASLRQHPELPLCPSVLWLTDSHLL